MPKNIVILCDGTGNEVEENLSNVLKLFRCCRKNRQQQVFYGAGVGTIGLTSEWAKARSAARGVFGLATGEGMDEDVLEAYHFLLEHYSKGDKIYLFGFSRGAYTVRVLAGFLHLVGLLRPEQKNLSRYALTAYKQASGREDLAIAWRFRRIIAARPVQIAFLGAWDTVSSVLVPRRDRLYWPSLQMLPYTRQNPSVAVFRQAMAIDEKRRMFRLNRWEEGQLYVENPFDKKAPDTPQDCKQVWFAGVHSDIGGGYPEAESGLSKYPLYWLINEAVSHGLKVDPAMVRHLALGIPRAGNTTPYSKPDPRAEAHDSMNWRWKILEYLPRSTRWRDPPREPESASYYLPREEARYIPEGAVIHQSVVERMAVLPWYRPENLPTPEAHPVEPWNPEQPSQPTTPSAHSPNN